MDLRIFTEPQQGATYDQLLAVAQKAEECGFDAFFRSDHYLVMGAGNGGQGNGLPGPTDAWVTLAGLARETTTIRLGTLVTSATFRLPGPLAISVAQVDAMSGGRVELGLGAGWFTAEHEAYGIAFPSTGERFDRLEEQYEIITGLWTTPVGQTYDHAGPHYPISGSSGLPKPVQQPHPPLIVGGKGPTRTPRLAARYAAEFNVPFSSAAETGQQYVRVGEACYAAGRDPKELIWSHVTRVCCGRDDAEVARRAAAIGQEVGEVREQGSAGTPAQVVDALGRFAEIGSQRAYLQVMDLDDLDHLELIAAEVLPQLH